MTDKDIITMGGIGHTDGCIANAKRIEVLEEIVGSRDYIELSNANAVAALEGTTNVMVDSSELRLLLVEIKEEIQTIKDFINDEIIPRL